MDRYQFVFDASPVALWLEDFTEVQAHLEDLRRQGVTDLRRALVDDETLLRTMVGSIDVVAANQAAVDLVGAQGEAELLGTLPAEILGAQALTSLASQIEAVWEGVTRLELDLEGTTFGGGGIDCILRWAVPTVGETRDYSRVVVAITDITSRKEEERQVVALYEELEKSHREVASAYEELGHTQAQLLQAQRLESIGELAAGIAHEINTPIQYVGDNVRFLRDAFGDLTDVLAAAMELRATVDGSTDAAALFDAVRESADLDYLETEVPVSAEQALSGIDRVAEIVRALKDFAHPGAAQPVPIDINHAIDTAVAVSRNEWKYVADLDTQLDPELTSVPALAGPLNQAILNIIINASHAIADRIGGAPAEGSKGQITISTSLSDGFAEIRIADTGAGIPLAIQGRVFDPFFTTKEIGRGSGQGLAIAHGVVCEQHGGTLTFETTPDVGTTFIIRIPAVARKMAA